VLLYRIPFVSMKIICKKPSGSTAWQRKEVADGAEDFLSLAVGVGKRNEESLLCKSARPRKYLSPPGT